MPRYLYNTREAPALPAWDRKKYPHAYMSRDGIQYHAFFSTVPLLYHSISQNGVLLYSYVVAREPLQYLETKTSGYNDATGYWDLSWEELPTEPTTIDTDYHILDQSYPVWCNTDMMLDGEGTLFLAASNPIDTETGEEIDYSLIPVTTHTIDPESLHLGYQFGQIISRMMCQ